MILVKLLIVLFIVIIFLHIFKFYKDKDNIEGFKKKLNNSNDINNNKIKDFLKISEKFKMINDSLKKKIIFL